MNRKENEQTCTLEFSQCCVNTQNINERREVIDKRVFDRNNRNNKGEPGFVSERLTKGTNH